MQLLIKLNFILLIIIHNLNGKSIYISLHYYIAIVAVVAFIYTLQLTHTSTYRSILSQF